MQRECTIGQSRGGTEPYSTEDLIYSTNRIDGFKTVIALATYNKENENATGSAKQFFGYLKKTTRAFVESPGNDASSLVYTQEFESRWLRGERALRRADRAVG